MWHSLRRRCAAARLLLLGSVSVDGLCPTHLPGWPSRYRSVPAIAGRQTLPHGFSWPGGTLHTGRRQLVASLASRRARRLRSGAAVSGSRGRWHRPAGAPTCFLALLSLMLTFRGAWDSYFDHTGLHVE